MNLTDKEIEILKNLTVLQLAMHLEDGLVNSCLLDENMNVYDFIKILINIK
jgi:hypothetical protein